MANDFLICGLKDIIVEVLVMYRRKQLRDILTSKKEKMCLNILSLEVLIRR